MIESGPSAIGAFEKLMGQLDYPMFVVTTAADGQRTGCLVGFATQASIRPPRFLVGLSEKNHTFALAQEATHLAVHVLRKQDIELASLFGERSGDDIDKFDRCAWHEGPHGLPILTDAPAWFSGRILHRTPLGDHVAFLVEPDGGQASTEQAQLLTYAEVEDFTAGHEA